MKVAVLGAGNCGSAVACDLSHRGHSVTLIKTSDTAHREHFQYLLRHGGQIAMDEFGEVKRTRIGCVTAELSAAAACDVILIQVQSGCHEDLIRRLIPYLHSDQVVLLNPGCLSTAYLLKHGAPDGVMIAEAESAFIDCRIQEPGLVRVGFRNVRDPIGVFPRARQAEAASRLAPLGFPLTCLDSVVEAAFHNPNILVHPVGALMSLPRIERARGDYCMYHEVFTPSVWRLLERLDGEKTAILEALGFAGLSYADACKYRNSLDDRPSGKEVFERYAAMPTRANEPAGTGSRYFTEDIPQGLVMLESFGKHLGISTPVATALIDLAEAALGKSFRAEGRTVERLGAANIAAILTDCGRGSAFSL